MIGVFHLVRASNGVEPVRRFVDSYLAHPAGLEHLPIAILKGFDDPLSEMPFRRVLEEVGAVEVVRVPDAILDVSAYAIAAETVGSRFEHVCFLNSFSRIQAEGWLKQLSAGLSTSEVGLAGATGSWASHRTFVLHLIGLKTPYRSVLPDRARLRHIIAQHGPDSSGARPASMARSFLSVPGEMLGYSGFPAPHVRTNAFILRREDFLVFASDSIRTKAAAYRFESGKDGLSARVRATGREIVVVDAEGGVHAVDRWPESETFWAGDQRRLLVADNQTDRYQQASPEARAALSALAWGDRGSAATKSRA